MRRLVVRQHPENGVKARLQRRARRNGRSMEEEVRDILRACSAGGEERFRGGTGDGTVKRFLPI